jgi:hypothetical protein
MELLNPRITVQNTDQEWWLVTLEQKLNADEWMTLTMRVNRSDSLRDVQLSLLRRAHEMVGKMIDGMAGQGTIKP